jgi:hypothetical protein
MIEASTGYLILEEAAEDRSYDTWHKLVKERLETLDTDVLYLVSDRAKALVRLAVTGLECLSMPDFFQGWPFDATSPMRLSRVTRWLWGAT